MGTVYLIVSDLHMSYKNKESRFDYLDEVDYAIRQLIKVITDYNNKGYEVVLILAGDIVDMSFKDIFKATYVNNIFVYLRQMTKMILATVGNHEFSYYVDNPFWTLVKDIKSEKIKQVLTKSWQPVGILPIVEVLDSYEDGEVVFHFNHFGTQINNPICGKVNMGVFHQDIICKMILEDMKVSNDMDIFENKPLYFDETNIFHGYDYAFMAHLHKVYGTWTYVCERTGYRTMLYYLASHGRPNHTEVNNKHLERNIPAVIVKDGKLVKVEDNKYLLYSREQSVKESIIDRNQEKYQEKKEIQSALNYKPTSDNPIDNILQALSDDSLGLLLFKEFLETDTPKLEHDLNNILEELRWI